MTIVHLYPRFRTGHPLMTAKEEFDLPNMSLHSVRIIPCKCISASRFRTVRMLKSGPRKVVACTWIRD